MKARSRSNEAATKPSLWRVPAYLPYLQPPLTDTAVRQVEEKLGVKLPEAYLTLLREQNGGYLRCQLPETAHSKFWGIGPRLPSIGFEWYGDLEDQEDVWLPADFRRLVPFDGDGHWYLAFDYRAGGPGREPAVAYIDLECQVDRKVAEEFSAFLKMLEENLELPTLGLIGTTTTAAVKKLETALKTKFERSDGSAHGYPEHTARLAEKDPEWLWLSPNEVPRGFVRKSARCYQEVVGLLPGTALRMSSFPQVEVIVTCTDGVAAKVKAACERAGFEMVSLHPRQK